MATPLTLFRNRLSHHWNTYRNAFFMIIDWVTGLYILVPAVLFAGYQYWSWWQEVPVWTESVPEFILWFLFIVFIQLGTIRWFIHEADVLFLTYSNQWMRPLYRYALCYYFVIQILSLSALLLFITPLAIHAYGWKPYELLLLLPLLLGAKGIQTTCIQWMECNYSGISRWIRIHCFRVGILLLVLTHLYYFRASMVYAFIEWIVLALGLTYTVKQRLNMRGSFGVDLEREHREQMRLTTLLVGDYTEKKPLFNVKRPRVIPPTERIYSKSEYTAAALLIKSYFRESGGILRYGQFTLLGMAAVAGPPLWLKILVWIILPLLFSYWFSFHIRMFRSHDFLRMLSGRWPVHGDTTAAFWFLLPYQLLLTVVIGMFSALGWWTVLLAIGAVAVCWMAGQSVLFYRGRE
ncbi:ABC transporter permease [Marinicrinis lubricantis]